MPAYMHHYDVEAAPVMCPGCIGLLPMFVRDVEPHWSFRLWRRGQAHRAKAAVAALANMDRSRADAAERNAASGDHAHGARRMF